MSARIALLLAQGATGAYTAAPLPPPPDPTPTPTPTPGLATITPGDGWNGTAGSGGAVPTIDRTTLRTVAGVGWPGHVGFGTNLHDWFFVPENTDGFIVCVPCDAPHDDLCADGLVTFEGRQVAVSYGLQSVEGAVFMGYAFRVTGVAGKGGWANLTIQVNPNRGYSDGVTYRLWINTHGHLTRPVRYLSGTGNDSADGTSYANRVRNIGALINKIGANAGDVASGVHIEVDAGSYDNGAVAQTGGANGLPNVGPITVGLRAGVSNDQVLFFGFNSDFEHYYHVRRLTFLAGRFDLWRAQTFRAFYATDGVFASGDGGHISFRGGCDLRDAGTDLGYDWATARAGGPKDADGIPLGNWTTTLRGNWRANRFFDRNSAANVSFVGTPLNPVRVRLTHLSGLRTLWGVEGEYSWSFLFPAGTERDRNITASQFRITGHENYWQRQHQDLRITVTGPGVAVDVTGGFGTRTVYRYPVTVANGLQFQNQAPVNGRAAFSNSSDLAGSAVQLPGGQHGQHWAICWNSGGNLIPNTLAGWPGAGQYLDGLGPQYPANRDGSRDRPDLGWAIVGYKPPENADPAYVFLLNEVVGVAEMRCLYGHGNHWFFMQGVGLSTGCPRNIWISEGTVEHPEAYAQAQHGDVGTRSSGGVTASLSGDTLTFSGSFDVREGEVLTFGVGSVVVRHRISDTQVRVHLENIDGSGALVNALSGGISNQTFNVRRSIYGMTWRNVFASGAVSAGGMNGSFSNWAVKDSTLRLTSIFTTDILMDLSASGDIFHAVRTTNSYWSGLTPNSGSFPSVGWCAQNTHWGRGPNRNTAGTSATGQIGFSASRVYSGTLRAGANATPRDRLGQVRGVGSSPIGSDAA